MSHENLPDAYWAHRGIPSTGIHDFGDFLSRFLVIKEKKIKKINKLIGNRERKIDMKRRKRDGEKSIKKQNLQRI